ncbi:helix-turn-helix domain-containing protein [Saccharobesus litoralis]|uniref:Helix-turn-helix domain-containing protein n=1 Tax=Saccharobesus litoralis TaxID=2172099 RepID=A0A2S0VN77_9ALTE|nr:helix-turn-helix domain-containing protein [Saccharobesus litoralis]AWB65674.1 helix-turn-helix domain-containing protein [Saccharobesus litoralis]
MNTRPETALKPNKNALIEHLTRIEASDTLGRSKVNCKLINYLVNHYIKLNEQGSEYKSPKEVELAIEVFGRASDFNPAEDAFVRVYISNLRKKLETYYQTEGKHEAFCICIPPGGYGLSFQHLPNTQLKATTTEIATEIATHTKLEADHLAPLADKNNLGDQSDLPTKKQNSNIFNWRTGFIALGVILLASITTNLWLWQQVEPVKVDSYQPIRQHTLWRDLFSNAKPTLIVVGDLFMLNERDPDTNRPRGIRDYGINSYADLEDYFAQYPHKRASVTVAQSAFLLKNSVFAVKHILPLFADPTRVSIRLVSDLTPDDLRDYNLIYLGLFKSLGAIDAYIQGSNFTLGRHGTALTDKTTNQVYKVTGNLQQEYTDYGVFTKFVGPSGNIIYSLAGFSDASVIQMAKYLTNPNKLNSDEFTEHYQMYASQAYQNFELMFSTSSFDRTDLGSQVISSGKLNVKAIWAMPH